MMSLSTKDSQTEDDEEGNFYLLGAFSPPLSSCSSDVESLSWDNYDYYKIYYENDADDEEEDLNEKNFEDDDHGPVQSSPSSHDESSKDEESADLGEKQCEDATDAEVLAEDTTPVGDDEGE